jgi:hypothetical protein
MTTKSLPVVLALVTIACSPTLDDTPLTGSAAADQPGTWNPLGGNNGVFSSGLVVANNADGRIEIFGQGAFGMLWHAWHTDAAGNAFSAWDLLGGPNGPIKGPPAVARNGAGELEVFVYCNDFGTVGRRKQTAPNGGWGPWTQPAGPASPTQYVSIISPGSIGHERDGRLVVAGQETYTFTNAMGTQTIQFPTIGVVDESGNAFSGFGGNLGVSAGGDGPYVFASNGDGRMELFQMRSADGSIGHAYEMFADAVTWLPGGSLGGVVQWPIAVANNQDGRLEIYGRGQNGAVWHNWQTNFTVPQTWSGWVQLGTGNFLQPVAIRDGAGQLEVFALAGQGGIWHARQNGPNGGWGAWSSLGGEAQNLTLPQVGRGADGRLEVFASDGHGQLWHRKQRAVAVW